MRICRLTRNAIYNIIEKKIEIGFDVLSYETQNNNLLIVITVHIGWGARIYLIRKERRVTWMYNIELAQKKHEKQTTLRRQ